MIIELEGQLKDVELSLAEVERNIAQLTDAQTWETNVKDLCKNTFWFIVSFYYLLILLGYVFFNTFIISS